MGEHDPTDPSDPSDAASSVVRLPSALDVATSATVRAALQGALDTDCRDDLVVDLTDVESVDAAGLGVLVGARGRADGAGRRMVLRSSPPMLVRLLDEASLSRLFVLD